MRPSAAAALLVLFLGSGCDFSFSLSVVSDDGLSSASADVISDPATDGFVRQDGAVVTAPAILCGVDGAPPPPLPQARGLLSLRPGGVTAPATLEPDVNAPSLRFFQLRLTGTGGVAQIVDGGGNRAGGTPRDRTLAPGLCVRFRGRPKRV